MAGMDSLYMEAVVAELQQLLTGAQISKVYQPAAEELIFKFWSRGQTWRLLLSCAPGQSRLHLVDSPYPNPPAPPRFCQLLRARLLRLTTLEQVPGERIVQFSLVGGNGASYRLLAELTGRQPNLVLVDEQDRVVDALKRTTAAEDRAAIVPGAIYQPPPALPGQLLDEGTPAVPPECAVDQVFERWLLSTVRPMSRLVAADLAAQVAGGQEPRRVLAGFAERRRRCDHRYAIVTLDRGPLLSSMALHGLSGEEIARYDSPSAAAEAYYRHHLAVTEQQGIAGEMRSAVSRYAKKLHRRHTRILADQQNLERAEHLRQQGELLLAQLYRVQPGAPSVELDNYYCDPPQPLTIELNPRLSPQENAEALFRAYKKVKRSGDHITRRLAETADELHWLEGVQLALGEAQRGEEYIAIRNELLEHGLLSGKGRQPVQRAGKGVAGVREVVSPNGYRIYWGVNNRANDHVSKKLCGADDLWFHAHDLPGCHLVLKRPDRREVPEEDRLFAAELAAGYSRGKDERSVPVMVSEGRWVVKPKGARPGLVTVRRFQTLVVAPRRLSDGQAPQG